MPVPTPVFVPVPVRGTGRGRGGLRERSAGLRCLAVLAGAACGPVEDAEAMTPDELRTYCLELNGARETFPFSPEASVFKVGGKIFAISVLDESPLQVSLKCEPELAAELRRTHPAIRPGYHLNKRHWNTVTIDGSLPDRMIKDMIEDSYDLVVAGLPRRERLLLDRA